MAADLATGGDRQVAEWVAVVTLATGPRDVRDARRLAELEGVIERALSARRFSHVSRGPNTGPADVYLCFDAVGVLLYVGVSLSVAARLGAHRQGYWWPQVSTVEVRHCQTRAAALAWEAFLIETGQPVYNRAGNPRSAA